MPSNHADLVPRSRLPVRRFRRRGLSFAVMLATLLLAAVPGVAACAALVQVFTWNARGQTGLASEDSLGAPSPWIARWATVAATPDTAEAIVVDLGNTLYPGYLSRFSYGALMNEVLNLAGASVKRVTVHDLELGRERLAALAERSRARFICANIVDKSSGRPLFAPTATVERRGRAVRYISVVSPLDSRSLRTWSSEGLALTDPVGCVDSILAGIVADSQVVTVLLCDHSTLTRHPRLLDRPAVDMIVCGADGSSASGGIQTRYQVMADGRSVVFVPPLHEGFATVTTGEAPTSIDPQVIVEVTRETATGGDHLARLVTLHRTWSALYRKESAATAITMDTVLTSSQDSAVGNLLREATRTELACMDQGLVAPASLARTITPRDLDRLLNASPDLYRLRLSGAQVKAADRLEGLIWIGISAGKIEGRAVADNETYSVLFTQGALDAVIEKVDRPPLSPRPRPLYRSVYELLVEHLDSRERKDYSFRHLDKRVRATATFQISGSRRRVGVSNPDSIRSVSGVAREPFSAWDVDTRMPLRVRNHLHQLEFEPRVQYAAAGDRVGRNTMEFRLDYSFGPALALRPYGSCRYQTYVAPQAGHLLPARVRATAGARSTLGSWKLKLGAGTEKGTVSRDANPFAPFARVFSDTATKWGPGVEMSADGTLSLAKLPAPRGAAFFRNRDVTLEVGCESYLGTSNLTTRFQSELDLDLVVRLLAPLQVRAGWRWLYANLIGEARPLYNLEPSLSLSGTYMLKR